MAALRTILALLSLGARAHPAIVSMAGPRADDVTLDLEPVITGGFNIVLSQNNERVNFGHIGRTLISPYIVEETVNGMLVTIGTTNLTINTLYDADTNARGIKLYWHTDTVTRLEDCINFGKDIGKAMVVMVLLVYLYSPTVKRYSNK